MAVRTVYSDGTTSCDLGGVIEEYVRRVADATTNGALTVLEAEAGEVRDSGDAKWYSAVGVQKRTGKSGVIDVVTTIAPGEIRVAIGSRDLRKAIYVHRPGPLSQIDKYVTRNEWWAAKKAGKDVFLFGKKGAPKRTYIVKIDNPAASDGKFLLQELVRKPTRAIVKKLQQKLPGEIAAQMRGTR